MAKRAGRQRNHLPTCYYEGYLEKRSFKDKTSRKLWTCLCGNALFFYNEKRDADYVEKLELSGFVSVTDDNSQDRNLDAARLNLQMKEGNIKLTAPNAEARELWKGYIHSVSELSVPSSLNLLPGQIHMLREAIEMEKERIKNVSPPAVTSSSYVSVQADMPACYHSVSRLEAELLLEKEAKRGNLLLRPGSDGNSFAVTTRQDLDGPVFRHYRVTRKHEGGFAIAVDNPVPCATLRDVIDYLIEKTDGVLVPLIIEEAYEKNISFILSDNENGEKSVQQALSNLAPPPLPPKPAPIRFDNENGESVQQASSNFYPPPLPPKPVAQRIPTPEPAPAEAIEEELYLEDTSEDDQTETEDSSAAAQPQPECKAPKKAIMPPIPAPRKSALSTSPPSIASSTKTDLKTRSITGSPGQMPFAAISELKLKFEQKAKCQE